MHTTDAAVIGAGILGCFAARTLRKFDLQVTVIEAREDVCTGITKANTGIIYTGCDNRPGSAKAEMSVRANLNFDRLCSDLDVRFSRCGSVMAAFGPGGESVLKKKIRMGKQNGVPGIKMLSKDELFVMEPHLSREITAAFYVPGTGTVNPWELGIAAFENAAANGADFHFHETLLHMERSGNGFLLETDKETIRAKAVINCAGLASAAVREMLEIPAVRIFPSAADYIILDDSLKGFVRHIIFHETETAGKGLTLVPTVDGNLLIGPTKRKWQPDEIGAVKAEGIRELESLCRQLAPDLPLLEMIRCFSASRPEPYFVREEDGRWIPTDRSIHDFEIFQEDGLISLLGIKTPGLTCADELGTACAERVVKILGGPGRNPDFNPCRRAIPRLHEMSAEERAAWVAKDPDFGEILCQCREISRGEIKEAIHRGAVTLDGVKRRTGSSMGRCQGGRCMSRIINMLAEAQNCSPEEVTLDGAGSRILDSADAPY